VRFVIICEGRTEGSLAEALRQFIGNRLDAVGRANENPRIQFVTENGAVPMGAILQRTVKLHLKVADTFVIVLTDVYPYFPDASSAKSALARAVGDEPRFAAHAACYDFEAWLLPFWDTIKQRCGVEQPSFGANPELVNHIKPPAHRLHELYRRHKPNPLNYNKPREAAAILRVNDLTHAANQCTELRLFLNTMLRALGLQEIPEPNK
jgi:hypothetical protein